MDNPPPQEPHRTLAIDVGGTRIKAAVVDADGGMLSERVRVKTPHPCTPDLLMDSVVTLVGPLGEYERVSAGFPGMVRHGTIVTAPKLGDGELHGFAFADALSQRLGRPVRLINDADMQGLAAIHGRGIELVITLGTGFGSALFDDGRLCPHLELSIHPFRKGQTYNDQLGNDALQSAGVAKWNRRVLRAINVLRAVTTFDRLYIGGGNAKEIQFKLDPDVEVIDNLNGLKGGAWLWRDSPRA